MSGISPWPPPFTVRVSTRARYARLRVSPGKGLEVVLPHKLRDVSALEIDVSALEIVERHKNWVQKTLCRFTAELPVPSPGPLDAIFLRGGTLTFPLVYGRPETALINGALHLRAGKGEADKAAALLRTFVRAYAYEILGGETARIAAEHGLGYTDLRFRRQKSRWGSCTARGALSLNTCLVFIPEDLARFVIMHELAHTKHMNHGQGFWRLLFGMEAKALALDKRLRTAWKYVPRWMWSGSA